MWEYSLPLFLVSLVNVEAFSIAQPQDIKALKAREGGVFQYNATANLYRFQQNSTLNALSQHGFNSTGNESSAINYEKGVCYIEVPTVTLVKDHRRVPTGNGSHPEYSRIRTCCKGYIRNIHNYKICDPICTEECVNGLCIAPETCACFEDHIQNLAGYCVPKCPIGCQNGVCMDGECVCKIGYQLESKGRFCVPVCRGGCGGLGNCTEPDTCSCPKGFESLGGSGSCTPKCDNCLNGDCTAPNNCVCRQGYFKNETGVCTPVCPRNCAKCSAPNVCDCGEGMQSAPDGSCQPRREQCPPGYVKDNDTNCVPTCPKGCEGGICRAPDVCACSFPNTYNEHLGACIGEGCAVSCINGYCDGGSCSCYKGYVRDRTDPSGARCIPFCPGGCPNGFCSAPNVCLCSLGYFKEQGIKGSQVCVRRSKRSLGAPNSLPRKVDDQRHVDVEDLLTFLIPDDE